MTRDSSLTLSKILIVDDEAHVVDTLRRMLAQQGYRAVESTVEPLDAIRLYGEFQPDLVVLDWRMPGLNGRELLVLLRAIVPADAHLPILVVTADPTIETRREALNLGASDFVAKPYDREEILARIGNLLEMRWLARKRAEEAMREGELRFFDTFEHAPIGVALVSPDGRWLKMNRSLCELVGYSEEDMLARTFQDITHPDDLPLNLENFRRALSGEVRSYQMQKRYLHRQGHAVTALLNASLIRDGEGQARYFIVQIQDITERQRAADALRKEQELLLGVLENVTDGIVSCDAGGVITVLNRATREYHGLPTEPIPAERWAEHYDLFLPDGKTRMSREQTPLFRALTEGSVRDVEMVISPKSGEKRRVLASGQAFCDDAGVKSGAVVAMHDITERRRDEEKLRRQSTELRVLFDLVPAMICFKDTENRFLRVNQRLAQSIGKSVADIEGKTAYEIFPRDAVRYHADDLEVIHSGNAKLGIIENMPGGAGEDIWVQTDKVPYFDHDGKVIGIVMMSQDITERRRSEMALQRSQAQYRSLFENMLEGYAHCRLVFTPGQPIDFVYLEVNDAFSKLTHLKDVVGKKVSEVIPGIQLAAPELFEVYNRVASTGHPEKYETYVEPLKMWLSISVYSHERDHFIVVFDNISERKNAEEELFQSRQTLRGILDHIPQRVFWKDRNLVYLGCNDACALDMGFQNPGEAVGKTDFETTGKAMAEIYRADDQRVIDLDTPKISYEEPGVTADGETRWLRTSKIPLHDPQGRVTGILGTYEDVTEHRRAKLEIERLNADLEERVAQRTEDLFVVTREAELANLAKSAFLSRTSHELRTPLNAILGFGQLLDMEETLEPAARESVAQILAAGHHLLSLIDEVLDISSAESGGMLLTLEPVAVERLVEDALHRVQPLALTLAIDLGLRFEERHWTVLASPQRLKQVLHNLLSNAIKYNRPGGRVAFEVERAGGANPTALRFCVRDTGIGISPDRLPRLFAPFDRLDAERSSTGVAGIGLGLAVSKHLVELMGGRIGVESVLGEGSVFWIEIPLADKPLTPSDPSSRSTSREKEPGNQPLPHPVSSTFMT